MYSNTTFTSMIDNIDDEILYEDMMEEIFEIVLEPSANVQSQDDCLDFVIEEGDDDDEEIVWIPDHLDENTDEYWMI